MEDSPNPIPVPSIELSAMSTRFNNNKKTFLNTLAAMFKLQQRCISDGIQSSPTYFELFPDEYDAVFAQVIRFCNANLSARTELKEKYNKQ